MESQFDPDASALPRHTTPTWEVELLISGVAVFAMLQLPGWLDDRLFALLPRLDAAWAEPSKIIYVYLKGAAMILAATFALHLLLRAHWIALVGMHSVYPDDVRWDRLRMGPVQREVEQRRSGDPADQIEGADNRATTVFAIGVMLATMLLVLSVLVVAAFAVAMGVLALAGIRVDAATVFSFSAMVLVLPFALASFIDRRFGAKLAPQGPARRLLTRAFEFYRRLGLGRGSRVMLLLASHGGQRRTMLATFAIFLVAVFAAILGLDALKAPQRFGQYALFPKPAEAIGRSVEAAHYDDQRDPVHDPAVPYVQSAVVAGPYLELVVPYQPDRDGSALLRSCRDAKTGVHGAGAVLDCLQGLHAVSLDGNPLPALRYDIGSDARTARPALLAMIDVRGLAPGRHELRIAHPRGKDDRAGAELAYRIPFWR